LPGALRTAAMTLAAEDGIGMGSSGGSAVRARILARASASEDAAAQRAF
jgi:hypothetical protein